MKKRMTAMLILVLIAAISVFPIMAADYVDYADSDAINNYWDDLWIDGDHVANSLPMSPDQYISSVGGYIDNTDGTISEISVRGWVGFTQEITAMGYCIDDGDMVVDNNAFDEDPDDGIIAAAGEYGKRYKIVIPVDEITGECTIYIVAKLADGTLVLLNNELSPSLNVVIPFEGPSPAEEQTTPAPSDTETESPSQTPEATPEQTPSPSSKPTATPGTSASASSSNTSSAPDSDESGSSTGLIIGIVAAVVVIAAIVVIVLVKKKKK